MTVDGKQTKCIGSIDDTRGWSMSGLRGRLLALVAVTLVPAFCIVLYGGHRERTLALRDAEHRASVLTQQITAAQASAIDNMRTLLAALATIPAISRAPYPCPAFLSDYVRHQHRLANIGVMDTTGRLVCSAAKPMQHGLDFSDRPYYRRALARREFALGGYQIGRITGLRTLVAAYPILDARGRVQRVLFAAMRLNWLNGAASIEGLPAGATFTVIDSDDRVLARYPSTGDLLGKRAPEATAINDPSNRNNSRGPVSVRAKLDGQEWLITYARVSDRHQLGDLRVLVAMPTAIAFANADQATYRNLAFLTLLGLLGLWLAWVAGDLLVLRPVQHLVLAARRIAHGDLEARAKINAGPHEIVTLGHAFDDMAASLQQRSRESDEQNARIARLNRIYQVLSAINGAIMRIRDRDQLLQEACRIAVELGRFRFAWVGLMEPNQDALVCAASAGDGQEFVSHAVVTIDPTTPQGRGLMSTATRRGRHAVSNDVQHDIRLLAWRDNFAKLGIHSAAAFPLRVQRRVVGALALYTEERSFFDQEELALFDELAADTSLGLEHIDKERQINYLAYWDPLTNLPNRSLFEDRLQQSLSRAERSGTQVAVLAIDIVHFGRINDTKGRATGDRVLQEVAGRLGRVVRESESLGDLGTQAARVSGHEFGLILSEINDSAIAEAVASRITSALAAPIALESEEISVTVRIGAAIYPQDGGHSEFLLHNAQIAVHSSSETRLQSLVYYSPEMDTAAKERYALEQALHDAVEHQQFYLEYQPRVDARTGQLAGVEALLRWQRPGVGSVAPDQFIPVLEETGLIDRVSEWVARTAFAQRLAWQTLVPDSFVVSINASSHEFRTNYVKRMRAVVDEIGVRTDWLEIEITETGLVENGNATLEMLSALKELGFRLSVDDFGTGYSSLSYLRQFPVDTLKIDRSFVRDIDRDEEALSIVRSVMGLAAALRLTVVAEGVETEQQLRLLSAEGCQEIQGYYFSRPLAPAALEMLVNDQLPFQVFDTPVLDSSTAAATPGARSEPRAKLNPRRRNNPTK